MVVVEWYSGSGLSIVNSQQEGPGFDPGLGPFCVEFEVGPVPVSSGHLPELKNMQVRLIGFSKLPVSVSGY